MTALALQAVQPAIYSKLSADGVLMGMVSGIYDAVPQNAALPYGVIGDGTTQELPQVVHLLTECNFEIRVWSKSGGRKTVLNILNRIYGLLHRGTLSPAGFTVLSMRCANAETIVDAARDRVEGRMQVVIMVQEL
jgi:hypothetical protein